MNSEIVNVLTVMITQFFLGLYVFLLIDFKHPVSTWQRRWVISIIGVVLMNVMVILFFGYWEFYVKIAVFSMTLPYVVLTLIVSKQKGAKVLFNLATCLFIGSIGSVNAIVAQWLIPQFPLIKVIVRLISFVILYFLLKKLREPYIHMLSILKRGWLVLCLVPLSSFFTMVFMVNTIIKTELVASIFIMYGFIVVCGSAYALIYLFFERVYQEYEMQAGSDLLVSQVSALTGQVATVQAIEEKIRIERHDLRHRLQIIATLLENEDKQAVLDYIGASTNSLDELKPIRWCSNSILNAIISSCLTRAKEANINIEANLDIPNDLPVDAAELSIVFANSLENAINACMMLPIEQRCIVFKCISHPQLMLEISNPYVGQVLMDAEGIPISDKLDHGIGTRSIMAFVKKHQALCDYEVKNGWFALRITL